jgi:hypothetical protein
MGEQPPLPVCRAARPFLPVCSGHSGPLPLTLWSARERRHPVYDPVDGVAQPSVFSFRFRNGGCSPLRSLQEPAPELVEGAGRRCRLYYCVSCHAWEGPILARFVHMLAFIARAGTTNLFRDIFLKSATAARNNQKPWLSWFARRQLVVSLAAFPAAS